MMSKITVKCAACGAGYGVPENKAGQSFKCTKCGADVRVPKPAPQPRPASQGSVQMGAGGGVLRKEDTVHGAPPVVAAPKTVAPQAIPQSSKPTMIMSRSAMQGQGPMAPPPPLMRGPQQPPQGPRSGVLPPPPPMMGPPQQGPRSGVMPPPPPMMGPPQQGPRSGVMPPPPPMMGPPQSGIRQPGTGIRQPSSRMHPPSGRFQQPGYAPPGYGQQGFAPPRKKSNTGLIVGLIVGGVVLAGAAVGIGIAVSGGGEKKPDPTPVVNTTPTPAVPEKTPAQIAAEEIAAEKKKLDGFNTWIRTGANSIRYEEVWKKYKELSATTFRPDLSMDVSIAKAVFHKALGDSATHDFPIELHWDVAQALLAEESTDAKEAARKIAVMACSANQRDANKTYQLKVKDKNGREVESEPLRKLAELGGFMTLVEIPQMLDVTNYGWLQPQGFKEVGAYQTALADIELKFPNGLVSRSAPEAQGLVKAEADLIALINRVDGEHAKDGFARWAAMAFTRFRINYGKKYFDSPNWTYAHAKPFVYFQELKEGEVQDPETIKKNLQSKETVLRQEVEYFEQTIRKPFNLKRLYPVGVSDEERDNAPLEIIVLADEESFQRTSQQRPEESQIPDGVRAYYSLLTRQIITYDEDGHDADPEKDWWNKSVLIHEAWHFLSAIYLPDLQALKYTRSDGENGYYPGYSSILVQEGLTDWVAGFEEDKATGKITFGQVNHLRLETFKSVTTSVTNLWKQISKGVKEGKRPKPPNFIPYSEGMYAGIIDLRGLVQVTFYGLTRVGVLGNLEKYGLNTLPNLVGFADNSGINYFAGCQAVHYLMNYDNGKYRDKWIQYVKDDYTLVIKREMDMDAYRQSKYRDSNGMRHFMKVFGLNGWDDPKWEEMNQEFHKHAMALVVKHVGTGEEKKVELEEGEGESDKEAPPPKPDNDSRKYSRGNAWNHQSEYGALRRTKDEDEEDSLIAVA